MAILMQRTQDQWKPHRVILLAVCALAWSNAVLQAGEVKLDLKKSSVQATGKATGHSFDTTPATYECHLATDEAHKLVRADFSCDVLALKTGKDKRDTEMYHWLEAEKFGKVTFKMKELRERAGKYTLVGTLNLHNVEKKLEIPVSYVYADGNIELSGEVTIDTTEFTLPVIRKMLVLTVDPKVTISFKMVGKE